MPFPHVPNPYRTKLNAMGYRLLNQYAQEHIEEIVMLALPNGRRERNELVALNPNRKDRNLGSFRINLLTGKWADFATEDRGNDVVSLIMFIAHCERYEALKRIGYAMRVCG